MARSCIELSKTACREARTLARYMAVSASRSRCSTRSVVGPPSAMPMLAPANTSCPSTRKGGASARCTRSATAMASSSPETPSTSRVNSSPPSRATVSPARRQLSSRRAICTSSSSPARWPRLSFTSLKRSRSRKSTAKCAASRPLARAKATSRRSLKSARLGRPVNGS